MEKTKNRQGNPRQPVEKRSTNPEMPLNAIEQQFVTNYIQVGNATEAVRMIPNLPKRTDSGYSSLAKKLLKRPNVKAEIQKIMEELKSESVATADEVMKFFTSVMRGEVKDQFGLDATLSDRTRAAQEIAKRTIDIENRKAGDADQVISIKLDWSK